MAQKFGRVESLVRKTLRARSGFFYSSYLVGRRVVRGVVNTFTGQHLGWVSWLRSVRWLDDTTLEVSGWAYERGSGSNKQLPVVTVVLRNPVTRQRIEVRATHRYDSDANARARLVPVDYGNFGFVASLDLAPLLASAGRGAYQVSVRVASGGRTVAGPFRLRARNTAGAYLVARTRGDVQLLPRWDERHGLVIESSRPAVLEESTSLEGRRLMVVVRTREFAIAKAALVGPRGRVPLTVEQASSGGWILAGEVPQVAPEGPTSVADEQEREPGASPEHLGASVPMLNHVIEVTAVSGAVELVRSTLDDTDAATSPGEGLYPYAGKDSVLTIRDTPAMLLVDEAVFEDTPGGRVGLRLAGRVLGGLTEPRLMLTGPRIDIPAEIALEQDRFEAFVPLLVRAWGGPLLAPQSGRYVLRAQNGDGAWLRVGATSALVRQTPVRYASEWFNLEAGVTGGRRLAFGVGAPLGEKEIGDYQQAALKLAYHKARHEPKEAVYFESFNGRAATCNPYALDREVARRFPDLPRYWGVLDRSVAVPEGAIPVLKGTREWWEARFTSRYVIANEWLRQKFKHQPFQVVLQTWHGSMFKRIGLDRPNFSADEQHFLGLEQVKWDILLAQNEHSEQIFRSAYAWEKPIWTEGYPRNDVLVTGERGPIRDLLGIRPDQTAILYAPTWREEHEEVMVDFLDLPEMSRLLGPDHVILLRGHSRTLRGGDNVRVPGVIDVTSYPHTADIFLAADAMITDYSSVMFDFSVTGRPMIFFTPDLDRYRDQSRGVYFDLQELAPGPVAFTQAEVMAAIASMESDVAGYAGRYAAWQERFNAHDDGRSSERVIERLFSLPKKEALGEEADDASLARTAKQAVRIQRRD